MLAAALEPGELDLIEKRKKEILRRGYPLHIQNSSLFSSACAGNMVSLS